MLFLGAQQSRCSYSGGAPSAVLGVEHDIAESAKFTSPTEYTVVLRKGLTFADGDKLTSSVIEFSFDRQQKIASQVGP